MRAKGSFVVSFDSVAAAKSASIALAAEKGFSRARLSFAAEGRALNVGIDADDIVAFRAAANGLLRNLQVFEDIEKNMNAGNDPGK
jgi:tRNA threonylcarbamoyladenosine modification (KEOPS) complex  Pcc1 subunit